MLNWLLRAKVQISWWPGKSLCKIKTKIKFIRVYNGRQFGRGLDGIRIQKIAITYTQLFSGINRNAYTISSVTDLYAFVG